MEHVPCSPVSGSFDTLRGSPFLATDLKFLAGPTILICVRLGTRATRPLNRKRGREEQRLGWMKMVRMLGMWGCEAGIKSDGCLRSPQRAMT